MKTIMMDEKKFWNIIKIANWAENCDFERIRQWFLLNVSKEEMQEFRNRFSEKFNELDTFITPERNPAGGSDDSHSDLLSHIIGLGQEAFEAHLKDYQMIENRGQAKYCSKDGYQESFRYCIPYENDYNKL